MLSSLTNIPQTLLFGRSPAGMNATGESDLENWYNFVERIQKLMLKPNLLVLLGGLDVLHDQRVVTVQGPQQVFTLILRYDVLHIGE